MSVRSQMFGAAVVLAVACGGGRPDTPPPAAGVDSLAGHGVQATGEAIAQDKDSVRRADDDSAWARFLALDDSARRAAPADAPRLLYAAGLVAATVLGGTFLDSPHAADARRFPDVFSLDEISASYLYSGWHFRELERRFPAHELTDDAGLALARLPQGGECEDDFVCILSVAVEPLTGFLAAHPHSEYAAAAVADIERDLTELFRELGSENPAVESTPGIGVDTTSRESREVDRILRRYADAVDALPEPLRTDARRRLSPVLLEWQRVRQSELQPG